MVNDLCDTCGRPHSGHCGITQGEEIERLRVCISVLEAQLAEVQRKQSTSCVWTEDVWGEGRWETGCGHAFCFTDDGPAKNGCQYCCYCGHPLQPVPYVEPEDPPDV